MTAEDVLLQVDGERPALFVARAMDRTRPAFLDAPSHALQPIQLGQDLLHGDLGSHFGEADPDLGGFRSAGEGVAGLLGWRIDSARGGVYRGGSCGDRLPMGALLFV